MDYRLDCETGEYKLKGENISTEIKRGEISWAYFPIAYGILLTISIGIIQLIETLEWYYRIILILVVAVIIFRLCFFSAVFRNKIVGLFSKSKEFIEKS